MSWEIFIPLVVLSLCVLGVEIWVAMRDRRGIRSWGLVAIFGIALFPVAIVLHNVFSALLGGEEAVSFILALVVAPAATTVGVVGVAISLWRDRPTARLAAGFGLAGAGLALFAAYMVFALAITSLVGENPSYQGAIEAVVLPACALAIPAGALFVAFSLLRDRQAPRRPA